MADSEFESDAENRSEFENEVFEWVNEVRRDPGKLCQILLLFLTLVLSHGGTLAKWLM